MAQPPKLESGRLLGHVDFFTEDPLGLFCSTRDLGGVVELRLVHRRAFFVSSPTAIRRVLVDNAANYQKRTRGYLKMKRFLGEGLVTSDGDFWLRQRRIAQPAFSRKRLEAFAPQMSAATEAMLEGWPDGGQLDVADAMNRVTLRIAGETLLGADVTGAADLVGHAMVEVLERFGPLVTAPVPYPEFWPTPANYRFWRAVRGMHRLVDGIIAERRVSGEAGHDLLGLMMSARDPDTDEAMTDRQLRDEALTMMLAGHETTANALAWTLHLLGAHPELQDRAADEARRVLGDRSATAEDARALTYTRQVLFEAMRLYPPVWLIGRVPAEADVLDGFDIPAKSFVFISQYAVQRDPKLWPEPERFDPERFGPDQPAPDRYAWFPFSRGRRQCIGDRFAEMEAILVLASVLRSVRVEPVAGHTVVPEPSITLRPRGGLPMTVKARDSTT